VSGAYGPLPRGGPRCEERPRDAGRATASPTGPVEAHNGLRWDVEGRPPKHMLLITTMAVKASRVLAGALVVGGASLLAHAEADRIDARPDEHYRRATLARVGATKSGETRDA
jgi:hypothetical protein